MLLVAVVYELTMEPRSHLSEIPDGRIFFCNFGFSCLIEAVNGKSGGIIVGDFGKLLDSFRNTIITLF